MPKRARWAALAIASSLLPGCGPSLEKFPEKYWKAKCEWMAECEGGYYGDADECIAVYKDVEDYYVDYYHDCGYDRGAASDCLKLYEDLGCNPSEGELAEFYEVCDAVWDC